MTYQPSKEAEMNSLLVIGFSIPTKGINTVATMGGRQLSNEREADKD